MKTIGSDVIFVKTAPQPHDFLKRDTFSENEVELMTHCRDISSLRMLHAFLGWRVELVIRCVMSCYTRGMLFLYKKNSRGDFEILERHSRSPSEIFVLLELELHDELSKDNRATIQDNENDGSALSAFRKSLVERGRAQSQDYIYSARTYRRSSKKRAPNRTPSVLLLGASTIELKKAIKKEHYKEPTGFEKKDSDTHLELRSYTPIEGTTPQVQHNREVASEEALAPTHEMPIFQAYRERGTSPVETQRDYFDREKTLQDHNVPKSVQIQEVKEALLARSSTKTKLIQRSRKDSRPPPRRRTPPVYCRHGRHLELCLFCFQGDSKPVKDRHRGKVLGGVWELYEMIGEGGMGSVYKAKHLRNRKEVAIKVLNRNASLENEAQRRFTREARIAQRFQHPNIVRVFEYGHEERLGHYLVMELLKGLSLEDLLEQKRNKNSYLSVPEIMEIFSQICAAVEYAHAHQSIHRDIKPANIFLTSDREGKTCVKLLDFGVVKSLDANISTLSNSGVIIGTPAYFSPEQAKGETIDCRTDIYSLTAVLFELFAGVQPFEGEKIIHFIAKHLRSRVPYLSKRNPNRAYPPGLDAVIAIGMAKEPERRFSSVQRLRTAVTNVLKLSHTQFSSV